MSKFRMRETDDNFNTWTVADGPDYHSQYYINRRGEVDDCAIYDTKAEAQAALDLYLKRQEEPDRTFVGHPEGVLEVVEKEMQHTELDLPVPTTEPPIRTFDTGATRDTDQGKLDFIKAFSPIVILRYLRYLDKHRKQPDGSYRDFDNWKKGIPQEAYISGGGRHFLDTWLLTEGYATEDNHGPVEIEDAICAQMFNLMGRLHEMLGEKVDRTAPTKGGY